MPFPFTWSKLIAYIVYSRYYWVFYQKYHTLEFEYNNVVYYLFFSIYIPSFSNVLIIFSYSNLPSLTCTSGLVYINSMPTKTYHY
jgi:hypothetical protein